MVIQGKKKSSDQIATQLFVQVSFLEKTKELEHM